MREKKRLYSSTVSGKSDDDESVERDTSGLSAVLGKSYLKEKANGCGPPVKKKRRKVNDLIERVNALLLVEQDKGTKPKPKPKPKPKQSTGKKEKEQEKSDDEAIADREDADDEDDDFLPRPSIGYPPISKEEAAWRNRNVSEPVIHNVVGKFTLKGFNLDINVLSWFICGNRDQNGFSAPVCLHSKDPVFTALIFQNGSCILPGARSEAGVVLAAYSLASFLENISGQYFPPENIVITNMMCTIYVGYTIDHIAMKDAHPQSMLRETLFNLLKFPIEGNERVLISPGGALVISGISTREGVYRIRDVILPLVARFLCKDQSRKSLEEEKKKRNEDFRNVQAWERKVKKTARVKAAIVSGKRNKYAKISHAQLQVMTGIAEVSIEERCYPPRLPNHPHCEHYVHVRYEDHSHLAPVGKMPRPMIRQLYIQNKLPPDPHLLS